MRKTILFVAIALLAGGLSAFRHKLSKTGWYKAGSINYSEQTDQPCPGIGSANCTITDENGLFHVPVYDSEADINIAGKELKFEP
jgi:hypothetical protein